MKTKTDEILPFFEHLKKLGMIKEGTLKSWRYAYIYVKDLIPQNIRDDVQLFSGDQISSVVETYRVKSGKKFDEKTIALYKSRLRNSVNEFQKYAQNPENYIYTGSHIAKEITNNSVTTTGVPPTNSIPIPIRQNCSVIMSGVPFDLTKEEAEKITKVIMAYAR